MKKSTLRRVVVVTAVVGTTMGGGIAIAAWTSSGTGTAGAKAGTASAPTTGTVDVSAQTTGLLYPGGSGTAKLLVNNPNPYPVVVTRVAAGTGAPAGSGGIGTCSNTGVAWVTQNPSSGNAVAANGNATITLPGAVTMLAPSDDGCQGATFSIPVLVTVTSA